MLNSVNAFLYNGFNILWFMIMLPLVAAVLILLSGKQHVLRLVLTVLFASANFISALSLYISEGFYVKIPFASFGLDMALRVYEYSSLFILLAAGAFLPVSMYSAAFLKGRSFSGLFMMYMFVSLAMINGAILSDNLGIMLFFWEGLLCTLFGMLMINNMGNPKTAVKALVLSGTADLLLMIGIIITACSAGTPYASEMGRLPVTGVSGLGFVFMMLGAIGKAGSMPFHSWIPGAAEDAPAPFLVAFPGALEKLLGIYLAVKTVTELYDLRHGSAMSFAVMTLGVLTIICAVAMALIQKDMKKLLSYHAISQVGYMVLGIGSALPVGIVGALFHMLNNIIYKSCLFMTAANIEKKTGTTDLRKIGGLFKKMPVTAICFTISGLAIAGLPPFNGFFSKELIFDAALESNIILYIGALAGAFCTAVSFLKMGRSAFSGKFTLPDSTGAEVSENVASGKAETVDNKEAADISKADMTKDSRKPEQSKFMAGREKKAGEPGFWMLAPMAVMAVLSVIFGVFNTLPLDRLLNPALGYTESFSGWPHSQLLVAISLFVLALAAADHIYGSMKSGSALNAADHIHYAPVLKNIYKAAEKGYFDPYNILMKVVSCYSAVCSYIERGVSWFYDVALVSVYEGAAGLLHRASNGSLARYVAFALAGVLAVAVIFLIVLL